MEAFLLYLIKSSLILTIFYITYQLFLRRETFFLFNRFFLLGGILFSICLPLVYFTQNVAISFTPFETITQPTKDSLNDAMSTELHWKNFLPYIYFTGVGYFLINLIIQSLRLKKLMKHGTKTDHVNHIRSREQIQPFSFFKKIIYNPILHTKEELNAIIAHEKVHVNQIHSLDILFVELLFIFQWFNPLTWLYRIALKQNLEFIADTANEHIKVNRKHYQYVLLNQSICKQQLAIINPFYNSLIKKRIVMINQNQSHKLKALKSLIVLPLLALFLVSFNIKKNYVYYNLNPIHNTDTIIELIINNKTTDVELLNIKNKLAKEEFDFSYTTVRNEKGEIQSLFIEISGGNKAKGEVSSRYNSASDNDTITPTYILIDTENNRINIGNDATKNSMTQGTTVLDLHKAETEAKTITIRTANGKKEIKVNGKVIDENRLKEIDTLVENSSFIFIENNDENTSKINSTSQKHIYIHSGEQEDHDIKIIEKEGNGFFFVDMDKGKSPQYYINGKKSTQNEMKELNPNDIETINVLKGGAAIKKYGKHAKDGVIEITLK